MVSWWFNCYATVGILKYVLMIVSFMFVSFFFHRAATLFGRTLSPRLANCSHSSGESVSVNTHNTFVCFCAFLLAVKTIKIYYNRKN